MTSSSAIWVSVRMVAWHSIGRAGEVVHGRIGRSGGRSHRRRNSRIGAGYGPARINNHGDAYLRREDLLHSQMIA